MPNIWTHIMFGRVAAEKANFNPGPISTNYFHLGAQGPDPFFYYAFWPWMEAAEVEMIGAMIHQKKCGPFLLELIEAARKQKANKRLKYFVAGFLTHHVLDRVAHPYVFYRSGNGKNKHQQLEVAIDTVLMWEKYGIKTWRTPVSRKLFVGRSLHASIKEVVHEAIKNQYPEHSGFLPKDGYERAYRDMITAQRILFDPIGWKNRLIPSLVAPFSYQSLKSDETDYLNKRRDMWNDPVTNENGRNESFYDLWDLAMNEAVPLLVAVRSYWDNENELALKQIIRGLGNRSYETGRDCNADNTIKFADPIV